MVCAMSILSSLYLQVFRVFAKYSVGQKAVVASRVHDCGLGALMLRRVAQARIDNALHADVGPPLLYLPPDLLNRRGLFELWEVAFDLCRRQLFRRGLVGHFLLVAFMSAALDVRNAAGVELL